MKPILSVAAIIVAVLASLIGLGWVLTTNQLGMQSVFAPKFEEVRRNTFETSKAYRDGATQELMGMRVEYLKADPAIRPALASAIKHKAAGIPADALPYDLANFIQTLP